MKGKINCRYVYTGLFIILIVVIALVSMRKSEISNFFSNVSDGWLGFWGGLLGAIIGVGGTFLAIKVQLDSDKKVRVSEKNDNTFFNLLNYHNNSLANIDGSELYLNLKKKVDFEKVNTFYEEVSQYKKILEEECKKILESTAVEKLGIQVLEKNKEINEADIKKLIETGNLSFNVALHQQEPYMLPIIKATELTPVIRSSTYYLERPERFIYLFNAIHNLYNIFEEVPNSDFQKAYEFCKSEKNESNEIIPLNKRNEIITQFFSKNTDFCTYIQLFNSIVEFLNKNVHSNETKNNYVKILKATLAEDVLILIYYYAHFKIDDKELLKQLKGANFFETQPRVNSNKLFWNLKE